MTQENESRGLIRAAMRAPYLAPAEEYDLALRWRHNRDQQALHLIAVSHMRLVVSMAMKFRQYGLPTGDLIQEGHIGLLEAAARFEPDRSVRFSTYASWWIRAAIQDFVLRNWSIVRGGTSSAQKMLFFNLRRLRAKLAQTSGPMVGSAMHGEIAAALGVSEADVARMDARLSAPDSSLNAPVGEAGDSSAERSDFLVADEPLPDQMVQETIDSERRAGWLKNALGVLDERERTIIAQRRLSEDGATLEALGDTLGISKERVRQLESRALEKLKAALIRESPEFLDQTA